MPKTRRLAILALATLLTTPAMAEENLVDIYQRALQNDPAVREAEATYLATTEVKPQARSALLPGLTLGASRQSSYTDAAGGAVLQDGSVIGTRSISDSNSHGWNISLSQTLFDWSAFALMKQVDKRVTQAETDLAIAQQDLMVRVATRYFAVLAGEDNLASAVAAREAIARQLEQAQRRFEVGLIAITDVQQSQAGYDDAVAVEIDAQRLLATAHEFLREIIGEIITDLASPADELPLLSPDPASPDQWVQTALQENLELRSTRISAEIAADNVSLQRANRLPKLTLSAGYSESNIDRVTTVFDPDPIDRPVVLTPQGRNWSIDLRFPIYTGGFNHSRIQQSVYQQRAATEALERVARQTERETRDAYLGVISEISRVRALRQSVESNRTALRATEAGFEVGTQTTVDVLVSQNNLRRAETSYLASRYDYILNVLRLKRAAGSLSGADVEEINGWLQE